MIRFILYFSASEVSWLERCSPSTPCISSDACWVVALERQVAAYLLFFSLAVMLADFAKVYGTNTEALHG